MEHLKFEIGFGGVMKATFEKQGYMWTVIMCDDGTVTIYTTPEGPFYEDLSPAAADAILKPLFAEPVS